MNTQLGGYRVADRLIAWLTDYQSKIWTLRTIRTDLINIDYKNETLYKFAQVVTWFISSSVNVLHQSLYRDWSHSKDLQTANIDCHRV